MVGAEMLISKDGQMEVAAVETRLSSEVRRGDLGPPSAHLNQPFANAWVDSSIPIKARDGDDGGSD